MVLNFKEFGKIIHKMAVVLKHGKMDQNTKGIIRMVLNTEKDIFIELINASIMETFSKIKSKVQGIILGLMGNSIKVNGKIIKCMEKGF